MTTTGQQAPKHPRWDAWKRSFKESNYITDFWTWLLTLLSKSAELVLFGSILYSSYQLVPGVPPVPPTIDAFLFLVQQAALDIGGMGLLKLAKRAGLSRESFPMRVGVTLVVLMIMNVVLASVKHALPMVPDGVFVAIETVLLIARAVMAVLFGHAIHALREEYSESTITIKDANELQQRVEERSAELTRSFNQQVQQLETQVQRRMTETVHHMETDFQRRFNETVSTLYHDLQSCAETLSTIPELKERMEQIESTSQLQLHCVTEEINGVKERMEQQTQTEIVEPQEQIARPVLRALPAREQSRSKPRTSRTRDVRQSAPEASGNEKFDIRAFVFACLEENATATIEAIQQKARSMEHPVSIGSISRYRKQYSEAASARSGARFNPAVETDDVATESESAEETA